MLVEGEKEEEGLLQSSLRRALPRHLPPRPPRHLPPRPPRHLPPHPPRHLLRATLTRGAPSTLKNWPTWAWSGAGGIAAQPRSRRRRRRRRRVPARGAEEEVSTAAAAEQQTRLSILLSLRPLRPPRPSPGTTAILPLFLEKNGGKMLFDPRGEDGTFFSCSSNFFPSRPQLSQSCRNKHIFLSFFTQQHGIS